MSHYRPNLTPQFCPIQTYYLKPLVRSVLFYFKVVGPSHDYHHQDGPATLVGFFPLLQFHGHGWLLLAAESHSQFCETISLLSIIRGLASPQPLRISHGLAMAGFSVKSFTLFMW